MICDTCKINCVRQTFYSSEYSRENSAFLPYPCSGHCYLEWKGSKYSNGSSSLNYFWSNSPNLRESRPQFKSILPTYPDWVLQGHFRCHNCVLRERCSHNIRSFSFNIDLVARLIPVNDEQMMDIERWLRMQWDLGHFLPVHSRLG